MKNPRLCRGGGLFFQTLHGAALSKPGRLWPEVRNMDHGFPGYLCLTDLLDQDLSAYEFFQTLSPEEQSDLRRYDSEIATFSELQARAARLRAEGEPLW